MNNTRWAPKRCLFLFNALLGILLPACLGFSIFAGQPTITQQPTSQGFTNGGTSVFKVVVSGTGPFTYQWRFNGTNLPSGIITTVVGSGVAGYAGDGGSATNAMLNDPTGLALDNSGNLFIADINNHVIRKVNAGGIITTLAGAGTSGFSGDGGAATNAKLSYPSSVTIDGAGNLYIADLGNNRVRKVDVNGIIRTVAGNGTSGYSGDGGAATNARLTPNSMKVDAAGNLYIADTSLFDDPGRVRKVGANGIITTIAGGGTNDPGDGGAATNSQMTPIGVTFDASGNLVISDNFRNRVRRVDSSGIISTIAGVGGFNFSGDGGPATNAQVNPNAATVDAYNNLFIADNNNLRIRKVDAGGIITTIAGNGNNGFSGDGGPAMSAAMGSPSDVANDAQGNLFIADVYNNRIRKLSKPTYLPTLTIPNVNSNDIGNYSVVISGSGGSVTSSIVALTVPPPIITSIASGVGGGGLGVGIGFTSFGGTTNIVEGSTNLVDWVPVGYVVNTNQALEYVDLEAWKYPARYYRIRVATGPVPPLMLGQPQGQTNLVGSVVQLAAEVPGPSPLVYQWQYNGVDLVEGGRVSGTRSNVLTLRNVVTGDSGSYRLVVSNLMGSVTSQPASVLVVAPVSIGYHFTNLVLNAGSGCTVLMPDVRGTNYFQASSYNGSALTIIQSPSNNSVLGLGTTPVILTVSDASGNSVSSTNSVTVKDVTAPIVSLNGLATVTVECHGIYTELGAVAVDNCSVASLVTNGTVNANVPGNYPISYIAVDGSGNRGTNSRTVTVQDTTPPVISYHFTNLVLNVGSSCTVLMPDLTGSNYVQASDLCSGSALTIIQSPSNNSVLGLGTTPVILTVSDASGNSVSSTNSVTVKDVTAPIVSLNGLATVTVECHGIYTELGAVAVDNCSVASLTTNGVVNANVPGTYPISYIAVDGSGNRGTNSRSVTVQDSTPPVISYHFTNLVLNVGSSCTVLMPDLTGSNYVQASDLCSGSALTIIQSPSNNSVLGLGTTPVILTVSDASGNSVSSTNSVTVKDVSAPVVTLNGNSNVTVECHGIYTELGAVAVDNCSVASLTTNGVVNANVPGTYPISYIAVDGSGNRGTNSRSVTVQDSTPPVISYHFTNLVLNVGSSCTVLMPDLTGSNYVQASDLCSGSALTIIQSPSNNSVLGLGTTPVILTVSDASGNSVSSTNSVTVKDVAAPIVSLNGLATVTVECHGIYTELGAVAVDNCSVASLTTNGVVNPNVPGIYPINYIAVDGSGNRGTNSRSVTVLDTTPPVISYHFTNLVLNVGSSCTVLMPDLTGSNYVQASDLCSGSALTIIQSPSNNSVLGLGTTPVILTVSDASGNSVSSTNSVTVKDVTAPIVSLNGLATVTVECHGIYTELGAVAVDNCSVASLTTNGVVNANVPGTYPISYIAVDGSGNRGTNSRTVTVLDTTPPVISYHFTNLVLNVGSGCTVLMPDLTGSNYVQASDLCSGSALTIIQSPSNNSVLGLGTTPVILTVSDASGNSVSSTNSVTVKDVAAPIVSLNGLATVTVECHGIYTELGAVAVDNCSVASLTTNGTVNANVPGNYPISYIAVDGSGNRGTNSRSVTVLDTTPPVISYHFTNLVLNVGSSCTVLMPDLTGSNYVQASDLCSGSALTIIQSPSNNSVLGLGTTPVILTVSDASGNSVSSTNSVTVKDVTAPIVSLNGLATVTVECHGIYTELGAVAVDNCSVASLTTNGVVNANVPGTYPISYIAVDGSGNRGTNSRTVTVLDTTPPVISYHFTNLVLNVGSGCTVLMPDLTGSNYVQASDLCSGSALTIIQSPSNNSVLGLGTTPVILTVSDASGNSVSSTNSVTVKDVAAPIVSLNGLATVTVECHGIYTELGAVAVDNCSVASLTTNGTVNANVPGNYPISYIAVDGSGNRGTNSRTVTVQDTTPPVISYHFTNLVLNVGSSCTVLMPDLTGSNYVQASDLCSGSALTIIQSPSNNSVLGLGTTPVILTVSDASGNSVSSTNSVTVKDVTAPIVSLNGLATVTVECHGIYTELGAVAVDNCSVASLTTNGVVNANVPGSYIVSYVATDGSGNRGTNSRLVQVIAPLITSIASGVGGGGLGVGIGFTSFAGTTNIVEGSTNLVDWVPVGYVVNTNQALEYVDLEAWKYPARYYRIRVATGPVPPLMLGQPQGQTNLVGSVVQLAAEVPGPSPLVYQWQYNGVDLVEGGRVSGTRSNVLTLRNVVTGDSGSYRLVVSNLMGSVTSQPASVLVVAPVSIGYHFTNLVLNAGSGCTVLMPDVRGTNYFQASSYNGSALTIIQSPSNNSVLGLGTTPVILTVSDASGNSVSSTNSVTVKDVTAPIVSLNGLATVTVECHGIYTELGAVAVDNCSVASLVTNGTVNANVPGSYIVSYVATDGSGNRGTNSRLVQVIAPLITSIASGVGGGGLGVGIGFTSFAGTTNIVEGSTNLVDWVPVGYVVNTNQALEYVDLEAWKYPARYYRIRVATGPVPPLMLGQPQGQTNLVGSVVQLAAEVPGPSPLVYHWQYNGVDLVEGGRVTGTQSNVLTLRNVVTGDSGSYRLVVSNLMGSVTSQLASVLVVAPVSIGYHFTNLVLNAGSGCTVLMPDVRGTNYFQASSYNGSALTIIQSPSNNSVLGLGTTPVILTVSDASGNSVSSTNSVTVKDVTAPIVSLNGLATVTVECHGIYTELGAVAVDNCSVASLTTNGVVNANVPGTYPISYIAVDGSGNRGTNSRTVTVLDTTPPVISYHFTNLVLNVGSSCTVLMPDLTGSNYVQASDLCSGSAVTIIQSPSNNSVLGLGTTPVILTVSDASGNSVSSTNSVTVKDVTAPIVSLNGLATVTVECHGIYTELGAVAVDNCSVASLTTNGTVNANVPGNYPISYIAVDGSGNRGTNSRSVTVQDTTPPVISYHFTNLVLNVGSSCTVLMPDLTGSNYVQASDLCSGSALTIIQSPSNNSVLGLGTTPVILTVSDASGNSVSSTNSVTVKDVTAPIVSLNGLATVTVECHGIYTELGAVAVDNCSVASLTTNGVVNANVPGTYPISYIAVDGSGNRGTNSRSVTVQDSTPPVISYHFTNLVLNVGSSCTVLMPDLTGSNYVQASDLCSGSAVTIIQSPSNNSVLGLGTTPVILTVSDASGNSVSSTNSVTVKDVTAPIVSLNGLATVTVECHGIYTELGAVAVDNCSIASLVTNGTVNANVPGTYPISYIAVDGSGNRGTNSRSVTVQDSTPPVISYHFTNLVLNVGSSCTVLMPDLTGSNYVQASDLCSGSAVTIIQSPSNNSVLGLGTTPVILTVSDASGNSVSSTNSVTVKDVTAPIVSLNGLATVTVECHGIYTELGAVAVDNCSVASLTTNGTVNANVPGTYPISYIAVDGSGNRGTNSRSVTVQDSTPPVISYHFTNLVLNVGSSCTVLMPDLTGSNYVQASDLCSGSALTIIQSPSNNSVLGLGTTPVILTVSDASGNSVSSTNSVTVKDVTAPIVSLNGLATVTVECHGIYTELGAVAVDNCSVASLTTNGVVNANVPGTYPISYIAVDGSGNRGTNSRSVTVQDSTPPVISYHFTNLVLNVGSSCTVLMPDLTGSNYVQASDLCSGSALTIIQSPSNNSVLGLGTTPVILTVSDASGNSVSSTNSVTVKDVTAPIVSLNGLATVTVECHGIYTELGAVAVDNCSVASLTTNGVVNANVPGTYPISYIAVDGSGNRGTNSRSVTVQDSTPPVISYHFTNLVLNVGSSCTVLMPDLTGSNYVQASDLCSGSAVTIIQSPSNNSVLGLGTTPVILTVSDASGNSVSSTNSVTVKDVTAPIVSLNGLATVTVECHGIYTELGAVAVDNCSVASLTTNGTVNANVPGTYPISYIAVDGSGNRGTNSRSVTVQDSTPPVISYHFTNLVLNVGSSCTVLMPDLTGSNYVQASDLCSGSALTIIQSPSNNSVLGLGTTPVILTVSDASGNSVSSTNSVTVKDVTAPIVSLNGLATVTVECHGIYTELGAVAVDNCSVASLTTNGVVNANVPGTYPISYIAVDGSGNRGTNSRSVTVQDSTPPVISYHFTNLVLNVGSSCTVLMPDLTGSNYVQASDLCSGSALTIIQSPSNNSVLGLGTTPVILTVSDASGNSVSSTNSVTVKDVTAPIVSLNGLATVTVECHGIYTELGAVAVDNCSVASLTTNGVVNANVPGTYPISYIAVDGSGNRGTNSRSVTVQDSTPPVISYHFTNLVLNVGSSCTVLMPDLTGSNYVQASDLCSGSAVTIIQSPSNNSVLGLGTTPVILTVSDASGNSVSSTNSVTVKDVTAPIVSLNGLATVTVECHGIYTELGAVAVDNCSVASLTTNGTVNANVPGNYPISYIAVDGSGNRGTNSRTVTVQDTTPPVISYHFTNLVLNVGSSCTVLMPDLTGSNYVQASDLCSGSALTIIQSPSNNSVLGLGTTPVILTVSDASGNSVSSTNSVTVKDVTAPIVSLNGLATVTVECHGIYTELGAVAVDNCSVASLTTNGVVNANVPGTYPISYIAVDGSGNRGTNSRSVTVQDSTPPVISYHFTNLVLNVGSSCTVLMPDLTGSNYVQASDLCSGSALTIIQSPSNNSVLGLGTTPVILTVSDASGNSVSSTNSVTVKDVSAPVVTLNGNSNVIVECHGIYTELGAVAVDNCSIASLVTNGTVNANVPGTYPISYIAVDGSGNRGTNSRTVTVLDTTPPVISYHFTNLVLNVGSGCTVLMPDLTGSNYVQASDLCSGSAVTIIQSPSNNSVLGLGTTPVILTVSDASGNSVSSTNSVTVKDVSAPVVTLNGNSNVIVECHGIYTELGAVAVDNCSIASLVTNGTVNANVPGTYPISYIAVDGSGNRGTNSRTVTVLDTTPPVISYHFTNLVLNVGSGCTVLMPDLTGSNYVQASDLCSGSAVTIIQSPSNNSVLGLGTTPVILTVSDASGNSVSSTNSVTVKDVTAPIVSLNGLATVTVECHGIYTELGAVAVDNCSVASLTTNGTVNANVPGSYIVSYVATDGSGNRGTNSRSVTVQDTTSPVITYVPNTQNLSIGTNCTVVLPDYTSQITAVDACSASVSIYQKPLPGTVLSVGTNTILFMIDDGNGNTNSASFQVVVADTTPPVIVLQPSDTTNRVGTAASFSAAATSCSALGYQWFKGTNSMDGRTNDTLSISNVSVQDAGVYHALVTSVGGVTRSVDAKLTVPLEVPVIDSETMLPDGSFKMTFHAVPGQTYAVLGSADAYASMTNWIVVATGTFGTTNSIFIDTSTGNNPRNYYIVKSP